MVPGTRFPVPHIPVDTIKDCNSKITGEYLGWPNLILFNLLFITILDIRYRIRDPERPTNNGSLTGYAEIFYEGQWGTICNVSWDDKDAGVFCRRMGYVDGVAQ